MIHPADPVTAERPNAIILTDDGFVLMRGKGTIRARTLFGTQIRQLSLGRSVDFLNPISASIVDEDGTLLEYDLKGACDVSKAAWVPAFVTGTGLGLSATVLVSSALMSLIVMLPRVIEYGSAFPVMDLEQLNDAVKQEVDAGTPGFKKREVADTPKEGLDAAARILKTAKHEAAR